MQKADKTDEIAASAEQKLPGPLAGVTGQELPGKSLRAAHSASREEKNEPDLALGSASSDAAASSKGHLHIGRDGAMAFLDSAPITGAGS